MNTQAHMARSRILVGTALASLLVLAACGGGGSDEQQASQPAPAGTAADAPVAAGQAALAGIVFTPPAAWEDLGPSGMRQAQFRLPPQDGDQAPAEVNVFYFGPNSGGGVQANLERWISQMILPEGATPGMAVSRSTFTTDGMPGHLVTVDGSYKSGGGRPMGGDGEVLPGYRLVGVVLEGPQGSLFFKLTGPAATAAAMEGDLMAMVKGARKQ